MSVDRFFSRSSRCWTNDNEGEERKGRLSSKNSKKDQAIGPEWQQCSGRERGRNEDTRQLILTAHAFRPLARGSSSRSNFEEEEREQSMDILQRSLSSSKAISGSKRFSLTENSIHCLGEHWPSTVRPLARRFHRREVPEKKEKTRLRTLITSIFHWVKSFVARRPRPVWSSPLYWRIFPRSSTSFVFASFSSVSPCWWSASLHCKAKIPQRSALFDVEDDWANVCLVRMERERERERGTSRIDPLDWVSRWEDWPSQPFGTAIHQGDWKKRRPLWVSWSQLAPCVARKPSRLDHSRNFQARKGRGPKIDDPMSLVPIGRRSIFEKWIDGR